VTNDMSVPSTGCDGCQLRRGVATAPQWRVGHRYARIGGRSLKRMAGAQKFSSSYSSCVCFVPSFRYT
jgi:hypothetical protein